MIPPDPHELLSTAPRVPRRVGLYLAVVQFFFAVSWVVYAAYLPQLAAQVGLPKSAVIWLLMLDQLIFVVADFMTGLMADRVGRVVGRLGHAVLAATLVSCAAFVLLPIVAPQGSPGLFFTLTVVWAVCSSALRAPPLKLIGRSSAAPLRPWLVGMSVFGLGVAGATAPYLGLRLATIDPRIAFVASSATLAVATLGIVAAERLLARVAAASASAAQPAPQPATRMSSTEALPTLEFAALAAILAAVAFQLHVFLNSSTLYQRFAAAADVPFLMPVFWVGFNLFLLPATLLVKRSGGVRVMAVAATIAGIAALLAQHATQLQLLVNLQFLTGGMWACVLMGATSAALALGQGGREGRFSGALSSLLALAALGRLAIVASGAGQDRTWAEFRAWAPGSMWLLAGVLLMLWLRKSAARANALRPQ
ncbi:MFS transporter [soil metagenome]